MSRLVRTTTARRWTLSRRAGLHFPAARVKRYLKDASPHTITRIREDAAVYATAVMEYVTAELLEMSGNAAIDDGLLTIAPRHIRAAIHHDLELRDLVGPVWIREGGVVPHIEAFLLRNEPEVGVKMICLADYAKRFSDAEKAWPTISRGLAGRCGGLVYIVNV